MSKKNKTPSNVVNGSPSKELFITMLTRDITLIDAISDLVDNCVDGAIKLRRKRKFTGLEVDITVNGNCFNIKDNCGGIDKDLAQNYAFRFGRPSKTPQIDYSVGQFGIGMKRALFKMGKHFEIKGQVLIHLTLLIISLLFLPVGLSDWIPEGGSNPIIWLLGSLFLAVGVPFFVVSSTAPLIQKWRA